MTETMRIIGDAMRTEADVLRVISQNLANMQTTAYRRQIPVNHIRFDQLVSTQAGASVDRTSLPNISSPQLSVVVDPKPATLKSTTEPLDLSLDGPGFFVVQSAQGLALTRRGDFHVSAEGVLSTAAGDPVLGERGEIQLGSAVPSIAVDGSITVDGAVVDQLRVVNVAEGNRLESLGDGLYRVDADKIVEGDRPAVRQGFLETSNVAPVQELLQLMETVRRFESEQKFARAYDGMLDKAISELGKI